MNWLRFSLWISRHMIWWWLILSLRQYFNPSFHSYLTWLIRNLISGLLEGAPGAERVRARIMRRTIIRYCLLAYILCIRRNSSRLTKRFPNMCELIKTGDTPLKQLNQETDLDRNCSRWWGNEDWQWGDMWDVREQVVDTNQVGHRGPQHSQEGEVHHQCSWILSSDGKIVRLQTRSHGGG